MDWTETGIQDVHRDAMQPYAVRGVLAGKLPWLHFRAKVITAKPRPVGVLEEFIIRCIVELPGISDAGIAGLLGLPDQELVEGTCGALERNELLEGGRLGRLPKPQLHAVHQSHQIEDLIATTVRCAFNPRLCRLTPITTGLSSGGDDPAARRMLLLINDNKPINVSQEDWRAYVDSSESGFSGKDVRRIEVEQETEIFWQPVEIIVFRVITDREWGWEVFDPRAHRISSEVKATAETLGAGTHAERVITRQAKTAVDVLGGGSLPEAESDKAETEEADSGAQTLDADAKAAARQLDKRREPHSDDPEELQILDTLQAQAAFLNEFRVAKSEALVWYPWVKAPAVKGPLMNELQAAVRRGVRIYIGYGIDTSRSSEDSHADVIAQLNRIRSEDGCAGVVAIWLGNAHKKQALFDRSVHFFGSHNLLSFRGSPGYGQGELRDEDTERLVGRSAGPRIDRFLERFVARLRPALRSSLFEGTTEHIETVHPWHWGSYFALGAGGDFGEENDVDELIARTLANPAQMIVAMCSAVLGVIDAGEAYSTRDHLVLAEALEKLLASPDTSDADKAMMEATKRRLYDRC